MRTPFPSLPVPCHSARAVLVIAAMMMLLGRCSRFKSRQVSAARVKVESRRGSSWYPTRIEGGVLRPHPGYAGDRRCALTRWSSSRACCSLVRSTPCVLFSPRRRQPGSAGRGGCESPGAPRREPTILAPETDQRSQYHQTRCRRPDAGQYLEFLPCFQMAKVKLSRGPYIFLANGERQEERGVFYSPLDKWQCLASRLDQ